MVLAQFLGIVKAENWALAPYSLQPKTMLFSSTALTSQLLINNLAQLTRILATVITTSWVRAALSIIQNLFFGHVGIFFFFI